MKKHIFKHNYQHKYLTSLNMYSSMESFVILMEVQTIHKLHMLNVGVQDFYFLDEVLQHNGKAFKWSLTLATNGINMALHE